MIAAIKTTYIVAYYSRNEVAKPVIAGRKIDGIRIRKVTLLMPPLFIDEGSWEIVPVSIV